jgi:cytochrome P450
VTLTLADLPGPRRLPGLGNALQVRPSQFAVTAERWCRKHGPLFRFDLGPRPIVGIGDAELINAILRDRPGRFRRLGDLADVMLEMGIDGVFAAEGDAWRRQRKLAVTALNAAHLHRYFAEIHEATDRLRSELAAATGRPYVIQPAFHRFSGEVTSALAFGQDAATLGRIAPDLREHINRTFTALGHRVSAPLPYWRAVRLPSDRALERSLQALEQAVATFVADARKRMQERPELFEAPENFLEGMLAAQAEDDTITDRQVYGNVLTMLLAGEDTTACTLAWTTWLIARHPAVQARLAEEAADVLGEQTTASDHTAVARLEYTEAVLRESLRMHSTANIIFLQTLEDAEIGDLAAPAGTRLLLLTRHAAVQPQNFAHPHVFDPERWLREEDDAQTRNRQAFLPFGAGPRFCPGRNLAFLETKAVLAMMARNFEVELDPAAPPVREHLAFVASPKGLRVLLRPR